jgi:hypothetical protein
VGLAFRMQLTRSASGDAVLRKLLGIALAVISMWPVLLAVLSPRLIGFVPAVLRSGPANEVLPLTAVVLGLVLALSVRARRR